MSPLHPGSRLGVYQLSQSLLCLECMGINAGSFLVLGGILEFYQAIGKCEEGVIPPHPNVGARLYLCASLSNYDGTSPHQLAIIPLDTQPLRVTVPSVAAASSAFFMSHLALLRWGWPLAACALAPTLAPTPHL